MSSKVSFWLMPEKEDREFFQELIKQLANLYDAPVFEPHVTIYAGEYAATESPTKLIEQAIQGIPRFSLTVDQILYSELFKKTVFVQFQPSVWLSQLSAAIRSGSTHPCDYILDPHLSLIYKQMDTSLKHQIATNLNLTKSEFWFDQVSVIAAPASFQTEEDVKELRTISVQTLS